MLIIIATENAQNLSFAGLLAKTNKTLPEGQQANMLTPITQWHRAAKNIMSRTPVLLYVLELLVISCRWLSLVVDGYGWLSMVADGCRWLQR